MVEKVMQSTLGWAERYLHGKKSLMQAHRDSGTCSQADTESWLHHDDGRLANEPSEQFMSHVR
jgi:hypothetical protein